MSKLTESSLSRIYQLSHSDRPFAILTAFRGSNTYNQNVSLNKELALKLRKAGLGYFFVDGHWIETIDGTDNTQNVSEDSIFVNGDIGQEDKFKKIIIQLGKEYHQDGVLIKTTDGTFIYDRAGKVVSDIGTFNINNAASVYTKLRHRGKHNAKFIFEATREPEGFIDFLIKMGKISS